MDISRAKEILSALTEDVDPTTSKCGQAMEQRR